MIILVTYILIIYLFIYLLKYIGTSEGTEYGNVLLIKITFKGNNKKLNTKLQHYNNNKTLHRNKIYQWIVVESLT